MSNIKIEFINHASVLVSDNNVSLLSDPWYQGDAFHKGWNLLYELDDSSIEDLLNRVSHIWISHEHPDHFSILFFKKYEKKIKDRNIEILFQETYDKRVESFFKANDFSLRILKTNKWINLSDNFSILNFKDGFYDSGLVIDILGKKILNLNDCEIKTNERCKEVFNIVGKCDVLISQFSYAAWKGGVKNIDWRKQAAIEKLETLSLQVNYFKPNLLIPFASYVYFSNSLNYYLNDSSNKPSDVIKKFEDNTNVKIKIMRPFEVLENFNQDSYDNVESIGFWDNIYYNLDSKKKHNYNVFSIDDLNKSFHEYKLRIFKNNSKALIKIIRSLSPIPAFKPIKIYLQDIDQIVKFDVFSKTIQCVRGNPDITMSSESLNFIMKNTFGFDTLTVNGCFEENKSGGFSKMTKTMAIENLNNIGISISPSIILRIDVIIMFIKRLFLVNKKIKNTS